MTDVLPPAAPVPTARAARAGLSRRQLLRGGAGIAGAAGLAAFLAACGAGGGSGAGGAAAGTINVLGWADYNAPGLATPGVTANWTPLAMTSDLYTRTAQPGTFDLAFPSALSAGTMVELGRLEPLDLTRLPNLGNLSQVITSDDAWARDPQGNLCVTPLVVYWSYAMWNRARTAQPRTFADLLVPDLRGRVGLLDDEVTLNVLARLTGYEMRPMTEQVLEQVRGMLEQLRPQVQSVYPFGGSIDLMARGEVLVTVHSNLNEITNARAAGIDAGADFFGSYGGVDCFGIVKGASNLDAAYSYINNSLTAPAQISVANASGTVPTVDGVGDQLSEAATVFGGLGNILANAPILGNIPAESANGMIGFADQAQVWREFKESL